MTSAQKYHWVVITRLIAAISLVVCVFVGLKVRNHTKSVDQNRVALLSLQQMDVQLQEALASSAAIPNLRETSAKWLATISAAAESQQKLPELTSTLFQAKERTKRLSQVSQRQQILSHVSEIQAFVNKSVALLLKDSGRMSIATKSYWPLFYAPMALVVILLFISSHLLKKWFSNAETLRMKQIEWTGEKTQMQTEVQELLAVLKPTLKKLVNEQKKVLLTNLSDFQKEMVQSSKTELQKMIYKVIALEGNDAFTDEHKVKWHKMEMYDFVEQLYPALKQKAGHLADGFSYALHNDLPLHIETDSQLLRKVIFIIVEHLLEEAPPTEGFNMHVGFRNDKVEWLFEIGEHSTTLNGNGTIVSADMKHLETSGLLYAAKLAKLLNGQIEIHENLGSIQSLSLLMEQAEKEDTLSNTQIFQPHGSLSRYTLHLAPSLVFLKPSLDALSPIWQLQSVRLHASLHTMIDVDLTKKNLILVSDDSASLNRDAYDTLLEKHQQESACLMVMEKETRAQHLANNVAVGQFVKFVPSQISHVDLYRKLASTIPNPIDDMPLNERFPFEILAIGADDLRNRKLGTSFSKIGFAPDFASDGFEAMHLLSKQAYQLVLVDLSSSNMDLIELVRSQLGGDNPILVAISTSDAVNWQIIENEMPINLFINHLPSTLELQEIIENWGVRIFALQTSLVSTLQEELV